MPYLIGAILVFALAYALAVCLAKPAFDKSFVDACKPLVVAHRGGSGLWPENTLRAFQGAVELGIDVLEMDIHTTKDGELVVIHDPEVARTTDGSGIVGELTLAQLKALDAGFCWTDDEGQTYPFRGQGITIPTVEEVFETLPGVPIVLEMKEDGEAAIAELRRLIAKYQRGGTVAVGSFHRVPLVAFRSQEPDIVTTASREEVKTFWIVSRARLAAAYTPCAELLQVPEYNKGHHVVSRRFVRDAHRRNMKVVVWTVNDEESMARLLGLGVDGLVTDRPDLLLAHLGRATNVQGEE